MNKLVSYLLCVAAVFVFFTRVQAAQVEVKWSNPDKYSDIFPGEGHRKHFKERTFKSFEKHFAKLANSLPENQKLVLDITNVDLAGDVHFGGGIKRIRVVKDIFFPRLEFSYQLLAADKSVITTQEVSLKDMSFLMHGRSRYSSRSLSYEKEMLDRWFKKTFAEQIVK